MPEPSESRKKRLQSLNKMARDLGEMEEKGFQLLFTPLLLELCVV